MISTGLQQLDKFLCGGIPSNVITRITSYNVCYTKLLRVFAYTHNEKDMLNDKKNEAELYKRNYSIKKYFIK